MSQSAIWDALLVAGDALQDGRSDQREAVLAEIGDAWSFTVQSRRSWRTEWWSEHTCDDMDCDHEPHGIDEPPDVTERYRLTRIKRPPKPAALTSMSAILKHRYSDALAYDVSTRQHPMLSILQKRGD